MRIEESTTIPKSRIQLATEFWCALRRLSGTAQTRMVIRLPPEEYFQWASEEASLRRFDAGKRDPGKGFEVYMPGGVLVVEVDE